MNTEANHVTVLLDEAVAALVTNPEGFYVDGTYGRGGHSAKVLGGLTEGGRLLAIDKDEQAVAVGSLQAQSDARFEMVQGSFASLKAHIDQRGLCGKVNGILLDLGVSSPQLDQAERGFSFMQDGPLDMRMDTTRGVTAAEWLSGAEEEQIIHVLKDYGEERFARRMAKAIVLEREQAPILTTAHLAKVVADANPAWEKGKHPATRAFQAIRIFINDELNDLEAVLTQALDVLAVGGRLVVISFHSLEDRCVKRFIKFHEKGDEMPAGLPVTVDQLNKRLRRVGKLIKPSECETKANPRARSAVMRVAEKIA